MGVCGGGGCDSREVVTDSQRLEQELGELDDPDVEPERTLESVNDSTGIGNDKPVTSEGVVSRHIHIANGEGLDVSVTVKAR